MKCYFHPDKPATHTDSIVDVGAGDGTANDIRYKRVPICARCAAEREKVNTSRLEPIEGAQ